MSKADKQYYIYIRSTNQKIPVSYEDFESFYKETSVFRRKQQRRGLCFCPKEARFSCDGCCDICPHKNYTYIKDSSLDAPFISQKGELINLHEILSDDSVPIENVVSDIVVMQQLLKRIEKIMPEAIEIGKLRIKGYSDEKISEILGIPRTTMTYRIKKLKSMLEKYVKEIL